MQSIIYSALEDKSHQGYLAHDSYHLFFYWSVALEVLQIIEG
jgi:hypothetical protein